MILEIAQTGIPINLEQLGAGGMIAAAIVYSVLKINKSLNKSRAHEHKLHAETRVAERTHVETLLSSTGELAESLKIASAANERTARVMLETTLLQGAMLKTMAHKQGA